jgi:hypothetical protein
MKKMVEGTFIMKVKWSKVFKRKVSKVRLMKGSSKEIGRKEVIIGIKSRKPEIMFNESLSESYHSSVKWAETQNKLSIIVFHFIIAVNFIIAFILTANLF